jgi:thiol-disulfide isomerase/thioredoxin
MTVRYISPEEFQHFAMNRRAVTQDCEKRGDSTTFFILVVVIGVVMFTAMQSHKYMTPFYEIPTRVSTMISNIASVFIKPTQFSSARSVSSKQTSVQVDQFVQDVSNEVDNLTVCTEGDENCKDYTKVDSSYVADKTQNTLKYLNAHPNVIVLIFAPWCPHCHTALPKFMEISPDVKANKMDMAIINAEMVQKDLLESLGVTHFPFLVKSHDGLLSGKTRQVYNGPLDKNNLIEFCKKAVNEIGTSAKIGQFRSEYSNQAENSLNSLFQLD